MNHLSPIQLGCNHLLSFRTRLLLLLPCLLVCLQLVPLFFLVCFGFHSNISTFKIVILARLYCCQRISLIRWFNLWMWYQRNSERFCVKQPYKRIKGVLDAWQCLRQVDFTSDPYCSFFLLKSTPSLFPVRLKTADTMGH